MTGPGFGLDPQEEAADTSARAPAGSILPGVAAALGVAAAASLVHLALPDPVAAPIGDVIVAVALGVAVATAVRLPVALQPGLRFCVTALLRTAIVLLGARLAFGQVLEIGGQALIMIVVLMVIALTVARLLARLTSTPPVVASLVGLGASVCGNSAIVAAAPVLGADDDEVTTALAVNTLFGMAAVFAYPILARILGLTPEEFGTWAGTAVNDTSQVVAVAFTSGAVAGQIATTVKLARNALMGAAIVGVSLLHRGPQRLSGSALVRKSFPWFVLGFLGMAVLNSLGVFSAASAASGVDVVEAFTDAARMLLVVALAAVGLSTSARALQRAGWRPFAVGFGAAGATSVTSLSLIAWLGPATG